MLLQENSLKQQQQLLINLAMKQALHVLQLPLMELAEWLEDEIESNPILEIDNSKKHRKASSEQIFSEPILISEPSLYEYLMQQAALIFNNKEEIEIAELIIGHFNQKGFLDIPLEEIALHVPLVRKEEVLQKIQQFDPPGVGAYNVRESLLLQLKLKQKEESLGAQILKKHFEDLLHNRLHIIAKSLSIPLKKVTSIIEREIAVLDLNPGYKFSPRIPIGIIPDIILSHIEGKWHVEVNHQLLPEFYVSAHYIEALGNRQIQREEKNYLKRHITSGKWLKQIVQKRGHLLHALAEFLLKEQMPFFNGETGGLISLNLKQAALALQVHESTIARLIRHKYLACPQGSFALRSFFKQGVNLKSGKKMSGNTLRKMVTELIKQEDKAYPLSDEEITLHFKKKGIFCARRTVAKYRNSLNIPAAHLRKKWV